MITKVKYIIFKMRQRFKKLKENKVYKFRLSKLEKQMSISKYYLSF